MSFAKVFESSMVKELSSLRDYKRAIGAQAYMKDIAPFLGVATPDRRATVKRLAKSMKVPSEKELALTVRALWRREEREYQYAANDILDIHIDVAGKDFLADHVEHLIVTKSWWDTVDGLGSVAVSPLSDKYGCEKVIEKWNKSDNIWLNRAAIQHQRGRRYETDIQLVLRYCDDHSESNEFFIVKAIGWALRDIARMNPRVVREFLRDHPNLGRVAVREAERGLSSVF